jgi:hypothetical protein
MHFATILNSKFLDILTINLVFRTFIRYWVSFSS